MEPGASLPDLNELVFGLHGLRDALLQMALLLRDLQAQVDVHDQQRARAVLEDLLKKLAQS